jgi:hypothetical protein
MSDIQGYLQSFSGEIELPIEFDNIIATLRRATSSPPTIDDNTVFDLIDTVFEQHSMLDAIQQKALHDVMLSIKWNWYYVSQRPHSLSKSPGAYADHVLYFGFNETHQQRQRELAVKA